MGGVYSRLACLTVDHACPGGRSAVPTGAMPTSNRAPLFLSQIGAIVLFSPCPIHRNPRLVRSLFCFFSLLLYAIVTFVSQFPWFESSPSNCFHFYHFDREHVSFFLIQGTFSNHTNAVFARVSAFILHLKILVVAPMSRS